MKIAFISAVPSCPANGGNRARQNSLSAEFIRRGHEVHFIYLSNRHVGDFDMAAHKALYGDERVHILTRNTLENLVYFIKRILLRLIADPSSLMHRREESRRCLVDEIYYNGFTRQIRALQKTIGFDGALTTYVFYSKALEAFPKGVFKIIDTHDSFSQFLPQAQELKGLKRADALLAIQEAEAVVFRKLLKKQSHKVITLSQFSAQGPAVNTENTLGAAFLGSSFAANREAIGYFTREVLPRILEKCPEFKFYVSGSICRDVADDPAIIKLGYVPTPADAFKFAPISLNPIVTGTGIKIKFVDSLLMGLPIVSTRFGVAGIPAKYLQGVRIVDDSHPDAFAESVIELYRDTSLRRRLAEAAYAAGAQWNHDQLSAMDILLERAENRPQSVAGVPLISQAAQDRTPARRLVDSYTDA